MIDRHHLVYCTKYYNLNVYLYEIWRDSIQWFWREVRDAQGFRWGWRHWLYEDIRNPHIHVISNKISCSFYARQDSKYIYCRPLFVKQYRIFQKLDQI